MTDPDHHLRGGNSIFFHGGGIPLPPELDRLKKNIVSQFKSKLTKTAIEPTKSRLVGRGKPTLSIKI